MYYRLLVSYLLTYLLLLLIYVDQCNRIVNTLTDKRLGLHSARFPFFCRQQFAQTSQPLVLVL